MRQFIVKKFNIIDSEPGSLDYVVNFPECLVEFGFFPVDFLDYEECAGSLTFPVSGCNAPFHVAGNTDVQTTVYRDGLGVVIV